MISNGFTTRDTGVSWLALFATTGTLICCALPILLVSLGYGATMAALTSALPIMVTLGQQKVWIFTIAGALLGLSGWLLWRPGRTCPADLTLARHCERATRWNRRIFWVSCGVWAIGFFAAYLALPIRIWLDV